MTERPWWVDLRAGLLVLLGGLVLIVLLLAFGDWGTLDLPRCPEDAVLVGEGEFRRGRWSRYVCGPAVDDYAPPAESELPWPRPDLIWA